MWTILFIIPAIVGNVDAGLSCKNMEGKDVDWFAAVKLPSNVDERKGRTFAYYDSTQNGWKFSPLPINSTESAIGATLQQLYDADNSYHLKIAYNDDHPHGHEDKSSSGRGHSKGVVVFTIERGFWLVHSVPRFPDPEKYDYPESGSKFAQSFICLTLSSDFLPDISQYLRYSQVTPFVMNLPENHKLLAPYLVDVQAKKSLGRADTKFTSTHSYQTMGGKRFTILAKHKKFNNDLWHDFIALYFKTPMAVETWRNGAAKNVGTQCGVGYNVYDITTVKILDKVYNSSKDHSKWGVSMEKKEPVVCIGDVNRQESQFKRGGGAVCMEDKKLWNTFHDSVKSYLNCGEVQERKSKDEDNKTESKPKKPSKKTNKTA
ncbi:hypothetical protein Q1695_007537 [Nippostrongylus brasiliensis]|nr:hypothetical protein Q1695_007537 [Nippostrongylus brasiliensis]